MNLRIFMTCALLAWSASMTVNAEITLSEDVGLKILNEQGDLKLSWHSVSGGIYQVNQTNSTDLEFGIWEPAGEAYLASASTTNYGGLSTNQSHNFYRLKMRGHIDELNPSESFDSSHAPLELIHNALSFKSPWGYKKAENASRLYPLLVSGRWGEGQKAYEKIASDYPAFVIDYQKSSYEEGQALARWIKSLIEAGYRIDINRIYLTGFSRGGSGSYPLAQGMYSEGLYFAAILRIAGQSQSDLGNKIAQKTAVWYHVGLDDYAIRVKVARKAFAFMKGYSCYANADEAVETDTITGYERKTVSLIRNGFPMFKYSEYTAMPHTSIPCYTDPALLTWLFSHSLVYR